MEKEMENENQDARVNVVPKLEHGDLPRETATGDVPATLEDALLARLRKGVDSEGWRVIAMASRAALSKDLRIELENTFGCDSDRTIMVLLDVSK